MGCINASVSLYQCIKPVIKKNNSKCEVSICAKNIDLDIDIKKFKSINIVCGLVCTVNKTEYLIVSPSVIWLVPENDCSADVSVLSNVKWNVF